MNGIDFSSNETVNSPMIHIGSFLITNSDHANPQNIQFLQYVQMKLYWNIAYNNNHYLELVETLFVDYMTSGIKFPFLELDKVVFSFYEQKLILQDF